MSASMAAKSALAARLALRMATCLFGQRLRLLLREAALGQALDEAVGIEGDGLGHA